MEPLFNDFSDATCADWKARLEKDLKGVGFADLQTVDRNRLTINPFYTIEDRKEEARAQFAHTDWHIAVEIEVDDAGKANKLALEQLEGGVNALIFLIKDTVDLETLLNNIVLSYISVDFVLEGNTPAFVAALQDYCRQHHYSWEQLQVHISQDTIGEAVRKEAFDTWEADTKANFEAYNSITIDSSIYQNAGGNSALQIALSLAQLEEYLVVLSEKNVTHLFRVYIKVAVSTLFFEEIAKLKALRNAVQFLLDQYGCKAGIVVCCTTSNTYRAPFDAYNNLLRDTIAAMAAVIGGADTVHVRPFDEGKNEASGFSYRMSRNIQHLLKEESYLHHIADIAAGSYYLDRLCEQLAESAWTQFKDINAANGIMAWAQSGELYRIINEQAQSWIAGYKAGNNILIGINKYPNTVDMPQPMAQVAPGKGIRAINLAAEIL